MSSPDHEARSNVTFWGLLAISTGMLSLCGVGLSLMGGIENSQESVKIGGLCAIPLLCLIISATYFLDARHHSHR